VLDIQMVEIKKLNLLEKNPRKISKDELDKLCDSLIKDPGFLNSRPVLVNQIEVVLNVYAGNQRVQAAKKLKWKEIPCIIEKDLSDELIKQRILKDNKHAGVFDYDLLANEYDIETLIECGFTPEELHLNLTEEIESKEKKEEKVTNQLCPNCGHEF
jgi:ParB-like chromosome segregation protein Spo0J